MADEAKLALTDTPNVAQVMWLIKEYNEFNRPARRFVRFCRNLFRSKAAQEKDVAVVERATRSKKAISVTGQVVDVVEE